MPFGFGRKAAMPIDTSLLDAFVAALPPDAGTSGPAPKWTERDTTQLAGRDIPLYTLFMNTSARQTFSGGLLRFLLPQTSPSITAWNSLDGWHSDWPSVADGGVFATDWLGRLYLFAPDKPKRDEPSVVRFDPATARRDVFNATFGEFFGDAMPRLWRQLLSYDFLESWRAAGRVVPAADACVCPRVSLALGGSTDLANLEVSSLVVWVSLEGQIFEQVKHLPPGTTIRVKSPST
jgi:hypothetical protein